MLEATLAAGAEDPVTDEPLSAFIESAEIGTLEGGGAFAARAELELKPEAPDSFVFAALSTAAASSPTWARRVPSRRRTLGELAERPPTGSEPARPGR